MTEQLDNEPYISLSAAARYLGVSGHTLKQMVIDGDVTAYQVRDRWRFKASELDGLIKPVQM